MAAPVMTLSQAAQSPDVNGALQQLLLSRIPTPEQDQWQKQARMDTMEDYQAALRAPSMGNFGPAQQGLYSMINHFGPGVPTGYAALKGAAASGEMLAKQNMLEHQGEVAAAKVGYENAKDEDKLSLAEAVALKGIMGGKAGSASFIQFKDDNGNLYIMNKSTGQREMIPATHTKLWGDAYKLAFEKATAEGREDAADFATQMANYALRRMPGGIVTVDTVQKPTRPVGELGPVTPGVPTLSGAPDDSKAGAKGFPSGRAPESDRQFILQQEYDEAGKIIEEYKNNPTHPKYQEALRNQAQIKREMRTMNVNQAPQLDGAPPMTYRDKRKDEQNKGYGSKEGEGLYKEYSTLNELAGTNAKLIGQLNLLEKVYSDPDIPEGELGPYLQQLRSGLKTVGIDVSKATGPADVARAISTQMALSMKNADGHNLLPGAMSNYEDQLLQKMAPTLSMTAEGRKALITLMKTIAFGHQRMAEEANVMAQANKGQLPPEWYQRKERIMKEEMARLRDLHDELDQVYKFTGKK